MNTPYIKLHRGITKTAAWRSLSPEARSTLIQIWEKHNGSNNGEISYSYRQAKEEVHCGNTKISRAFKELQDKGFLIERRKGSFHQKTDGGARRASEWELTAEPCDGQPAKLNYRSYKP